MGKFENLLLIFTILILTGCTIKYNIKLQQFDLPIDASHINHNNHINIITPQNSGFLEVENFNIILMKGTNLQVNLNELYIILKELFGKTLNVNNNSDKWIKITIDKIQFTSQSYLLFSILEAHMFFTVETEDGIMKSFKAYNKSGNIDRAISGCINKIVHIIIDDIALLNYINKGEY